MTTWARRTLLAVGCALVLGACGTQSDDGAGVDGTGMGRHQRGTDGVLVRDAAGPEQSLELGRGRRGGG